MPSERIQRRIDALLDEADEAVSGNQWSLVADKARAVLAIDRENEDAASFLQMAVANGVAAEVSPRDAKRTAISVEEPARSVVEAAAIVEQLEAAQATPESDPESFAGGRYRVLRFLGEGGKKRVFLAHDALLDRNVAFSLIKTDGLDDVGRERIMREAQAMGRLTYQHIVAIYDIGEHTAPDGTKQPYLVQELMGGGDVEGLLEDAGGPLPLPRALAIAIATARGLEFAHAQGVIHRDLKPGNVWLTADGVAKIGDLGLAVTLGQTRLTEHGMMVGTYGYMPPEQALGHEVTARADLYSLGAMLYELVTGRPPFQGDTATAVISQHLNTQPVAPSWYSDRCPPDLEALILRLLAKAPADRPASATEVIATLEAVDPEGVSASHSDSSANPLDRLARGVFVGRQKELSQLRAAFDDALIGRGGVVMLVGEPGIGKTRTVQELETYARMRGARVFWGRTHESAGMPAYWPWIQVGRAWGAARDFTTAATQSAVSNPELVRLFPELRQLLPGLPEPAAADESENAQFHLFDAYTQFMRAQSSEEPWVVVLDDLHWADKPTLQLLQFAARELSNMNVLIVGTYRDTDLVRTHPLSEALAELNREGRFRRIVLKGLATDEVAAYVRQRTNVEPSPALIERVHQETEGNPFFLSEVVNLMAEEGALSSGAVTDIALPDGVREALGRRLDRLSEDANQILQVAAVIGREFAYDTLDLLERQDPDALLKLIEEGLRARVIEETEQPGRYRFTHALMQETLLEELTTTRRVRLHGEVAEALERRWGARADEFASRLAMHYAESATLTAGHTVKAVHYLVQAAREAEAGFGSGAATRLYERALAMIDESDGVEFENDLAEVLLGLARNAVFNQRFRDFWRATMRALDLYRGREDGLGFARAAVVLGNVGGVVASARLVPIWEEALDMLGDQDEVLWAELAAHLDSASSRLHSTATQEVLTGRRERANAIAKRRNLPAVQWRIRGYAANDAAEAGEFEAAIELLSADGVLDSESPAPAALSATATLVYAAAHAGDLDRTVRLMEWAARVHERAGNDTLAVAHGHGLADIYLARGEVEAAERLQARFADRLNPGWDGVNARWAVFRGAGDQAASLLPEPVTLGAPLYAVVTHGDRAIVFAHLGRWDEAAAEYDRFREAIRVSGRRGLAAGQSIHGADVGQILGAWALADGFVWRFADESETDALRAVIKDPPGLFLGRFWEFASVQRQLGDCALGLNMLDDAQRLFRDALPWCQRERCGVEAGRCHLGLATIAERRGDTAAATEHLDSAGELFASANARFFLDQVIAKKEILKA